MTNPLETLAATAADLVDTQPPLAVTLTTTTGTIEFTPAGRQFASGFRPVLDVLARTLDATVVRTGEPGRQGYRTEGTYHGVRVLGSVPYQVGDLIKGRTTTTDDTAAALRTLAPWAADLPPEAFRLWLSDDRTRHSGTLMTWGNATTEIRELVSAGTLNADLGALISSLTVINGPRPRPSTDETTKENP